jgi:hypothetical protein
VPLLPRAKGMDVIGRYAKLPIVVKRLRRKAKLSSHLPDKSIASPNHRPVTIQGVQRLIRHGYLQFASFNSSG